MRTPRPALTRVSIAIGVLSLLLVASPAAASGRPSLDAAMARLDLLSAEDRALICRAAVLGVTFDPQLLADVLEPGTRPPDERTWARL